MEKNLTYHEKLLAYIWYALEKQDADLLTSASILLHDQAETLKVLEIINTK